MLVFEQSRGKKDPFELLCLDEVTCEEHVTPCVVPLGPEGCFVTPQHRPTQLALQVLPFVEGTEGSFLGLTAPLLVGSSPSAATIPSRLGAFLQTESGQALFACPL